MEEDLVCGMDVDPKTASIKSVYMGKTYYFCYPGCKREFDRQPEKYIKFDRQRTGHESQHT